MKDSKEGTILAAYSSSLTLTNSNNENWKNDAYNSQKHQQEETKFDQLYSRSSSFKAELVEGDTIGG